MRPFKKQNPPRDCPCCGAIGVFASDSLFDICDICNWEDDPVQRDDPEYEGGANVLSLKQAQKNFKTHGHSDPSRR